MHRERYKNRYTHTYRPFGKAQKWQSPMLMQWATRCASLGCGFECFDFATRPGEK